MGHADSRKPGPRDIPAAWAGLSELERRLLNDFQRDFPLVPKPWAELARTLGTEPAVVTEALWQLRGQGMVSRVGPVFRPHSVGTSTLAAMAVPPERLEAVARQVSACAQVNHNYEREHRLNLWFVVAAADEPQLERCLRDITRETGLEVLSLPLLEAYHLDLGFDLRGDRRRRQPPPGHAAPARSRLRDPADLALVAAVQQGLPLVPRPFAAVGAQAGLGEAEVIERLRAWHAGGVISRIGVVVRHHELGYRANAMVVWDIPDAQVSEIGWCMAGYDFVTLCYQRPRRLPRWRYNLFCMIHGRDREAVLEQVAELERGCGLETAPHEVLFSVRRFKQCGARYQGFGNGSRPQVRSA